MQSHSVRLLCLVLLTVLVVTACSTGIPSQQQGATSNQDNTHSVSGDTTLQQRAASNQVSPPSASDNVSGTYVSTGSAGVAVLRLVDTHTNVLGELDLVTVDTQLGQVTTKTTQSSNVTGNASSGNIAIQVSASDGTSSITMTGSFDGDHIDLTTQGNQLRFTRTNAAGLQNAIAAAARQSQHNAVEEEAAGAVRDATSQIQDLTSDLNAFVKGSTTSPNPYQVFPDSVVRDFRQNAENSQTLYVLSSLLVRRFVKIAQLDSEINTAPCGKGHHLPACASLLAAEKEYTAARPSALAAVEAARQEWMGYACKGAGGGTPGAISLCDKTIQLPVVTAAQYGDPPISQGSTPVEVTGNTTSIGVTTEGMGTVRVGLKSDSLVGVVRGPGAMEGDVGAQTIAVNGTANTIFRVALPAVGSDGTPRAPYVEFPIQVVYSIRPFPRPQTANVGTVFVRERVLNPTPSSR